MSQKQAKRLRRIEKDITTLHNAHYSTAVRIAQLEEQLYIAPELKTSPWHRLRLWLQH